MPWNAKYDVHVFVGLVLTAVASIIAAVCTGSEPLMWLGVLTGSLLVIGVVCLAAYAAFLLVKGSWWFIVDSFHNTLALLEKGNPDRA